MSNGGQRDLAIPPKQAPNIASAETGWIQLSKVEIQAFLDTISRTDRYPGREADGSDDSRLAGDEELVTILASDQFTGPRYERFASELARYAIAVLIAWIHSGHIFKRCADRSYLLSPSAIELAELRSNSELRQDLAIDTVAKTLPRFRDRALIGRAWKADGGASLTTYFMGATTEVFPNEFRRFRAQHQRWAQQEPNDQAIDNDETPSPSDPIDELVGDLRVQEHLKSLTHPRERAIVFLTVYGYNQQEIAEILCERSVRAVEGVMHRWRKKTLLQHRDGGV